MTQEQTADLKRYIPESDTVKMAFEAIVGKEISDWEKEVQSMVDAALAGDKTALFDILELTYLNAHNEGFLDGTEETAFHPA